MPVLLIDHLTGVLPDKLKCIGLAGLFLIFALLKFSQTVDADRDDRIVRERGRDDCAVSIQLETLGWMITTDSVLKTDQSYPQWYK